MEELDYLRLHTCGKFKCKGEFRDVCSFCAAIATSPEKRSKAMEVVIDGEKLQLEMQELLRMMPLIVDVEAKRRNVLKCLVNFTHMCLMYDSSFPRLTHEVKVLLAREAFKPEIGHAYSCFSDKKGSPQQFVSEQAATITSPEELLAVLPMLMYVLKGRKEHMATFVPLIALEALKGRRDQWDAVLQRHGLTANAVEGVVRSALSVASHFPQPHSDPDCACCKGIDAALQGSLQYNMERMKLIDPTSRWFCEDVARIHITVNKDPAQAMQAIYPALTLAEEQKDDLKACPLQWIYCHFLLLTGSRPGHFITVSDFLEHVRKAKKTKARLDSWGEFRCPETGGWTPVPGTTLAESDSYWCSLGVAEFARDTIKLTAAFADTQLPAFDGTKLKDWQDAVRCHACKELCDHLLLCAGCQLAKYCSKECQKKHWKSGHKEKCTAAASKKST